ncbi:tol-pal system protein YbgF [Methylocystis bryophila]|nr:tol-pal system protein YbgF [Methylocystis bryophila]BDV37832.1 tol-pal system protein YbgF [Methylocystis bryophila]
MLIPRAIGAILLVFVGVIAAPRATEAQYLNRSAPDGYDVGEPAGPDRDSVLINRVDRLERELRKATGQIEELQHQVQGLEEQLRARPESAALPAPASAPVAGRPQTAPVGGSRDAFDPAANPTAAGAPRPLGQTTPSAPLTPSDTARTGSRDPGAPMDLTPPGLQGAPSATRPAAEASPASMKEEYEQAAALMQQQQYEAAERALTAFLAKYPKSKYVPAATFGLGESFFLRSRFREAAEKFLDIKKKHPQSAQTPEALLRLGQSLAEIGAHEEACQSFADIGASYPQSPARVRESAVREIKKHQC